MEMENVINVIDFFVVTTVIMNLFLRNAAMKRKNAIVPNQKNTNVIFVYTEFIAVQNLKLLINKHHFFQSLIQKRDIK